VPGAAPGSPQHPPGVEAEGEKSFAVPGQLLAAAVASADHMAQGILASHPAGAAVVQVGGPPCCSRHAPVDAG
jgi:hypothetical protein